MPALYSHTTRANGTVLTATIYNGDHQNHIDNGVPAQLDDYSINLGQMQTVTNPGVVGSESLATSLAGELERIRYVLRSLTQGAQWYSGAAIEGLLGYSRVHGQTGANNSGSPATQIDFAAEAVVLRSSTGGTVVRTNTGTVTNNISTAGPAANGRDQAGAFSVGTWIHFYWIWNGTTLATISSTTAPPTGPALPSGYTHWAYIGPIRFKGNGELIRVILSGGNFVYRELLNALTAGTATTYTNINAALSTLIPPNCNTYSMFGEVSGISSGAGAWDILVSFSYDGANEHVRPVRLSLTGLGASALQITTAVVPQLGGNSQNLFYLISNISGTSGSMTLRVSNYSVSNGDN